MAVGRSRSSTKGRCLVPLSSIWRATSSTVSSGRADITGVRRWSATLAFGDTPGGPLRPRFGPDPVPVTYAPPETEATTTTAPEATTTTTTSSE